MAVNVGQALLQDAKERNLDITRQALRRLGNVERDLHAAALGKLLRIPGCGRTESGFVQARGMQEMGNGADLSQGLVEEVDAVGVSAIAVIGGEGSEDHLGGGQVLSGAVVQFASELAAFFVL